MKMSNVNDNTVAECPLQIFVYFLIDFYELCYLLYYLNVWQ